jgi:hypothetical protein
MRFTVTYHAVYSQLNSEECALLKAMQAAKWTKPCRSMPPVSLNPIIYQCAVDNVMGKRKPPFMYQYTIRVLVEE